VLRFVQLFLGTWLKLQTIAFKFWLEFLVHIPPTPISCTPNPRHTFHKPKPLKQNHNKVLSQTCVNKINFFGEERMEKRFNLITELLEWSIWGLILQGKYFVGNFLGAFWKHLLVSFLFLFIFNEKYQAPPLNTRDFQLLQCLCFIRILLFLKRRTRRLHQRSETGMTNPYWSVGRVRKNYQKYWLFWGTFWKKSWKITQSIEKVMNFHSNLARKNIFLDCWLATSDIKQQLNYAFEFIWWRRLVLFKKPYNNFHSGVDKIAWIKSR
jgi:hypothetical protein